MGIFLFILFIYFVLIVLESFFTPRHGKLELIMGKAGSGKSTLIAHIVRKCNKVNRPVFCNHHVLGAQKIDSEYLGKYLYQDCTIIIDEAQIEFDNRNFKSFTKELKFFFSNYRHFKCDVYIVSQSWEDLDIKIRRQATKMFIMQKSFIPFTLLLQRVRIRFGVNDDKTDIITKFSTNILPVIGWTLKLNFTVWKYFNSYSIPKMPLPPKLGLWGEVNSDKSFDIVSKFRHLFDYKLIRFTGTRVYEFIHKDRFNKD